MYCAFRQMTGFQLFIHAISLVSSVLLGKLCMMEYDVIRLEMNLKELRIQPSSVEV
jgi:hypothetical protein